MFKLVEPELIKIPLSRLLKVEVPRFALRVIGIVEQYNPEELQIKELYDLLVAEKPNIDKLTDKYGPHPETEDLVNLRKMRALYISTIRFHLKVVIREDKSGVNRNVKTVREHLNHFFNNLEASKNEEMFNQKIVQFLDEVNRNAELQTAIATLKFTEHIDNLQMVHVEIQELIDVRLDTKSERLTESTAQLRESVLRATRNLIKQIEIAPLKHTDLDYEPLFVKLNLLMIEFRDLINKRALYNKRKAEGKKNGENDESTEGTTTTQSTESTENMSHRFTKERMNGNGLEEEPMNEEKATAPSSKTMQLPLSDDKEAQQVNAE